MVQLPFGKSAFQLISKLRFNGGCLPKLRFILWLTPRFHRKRIAHTLQIAPFLDAGAVFNTNDNPNSLSQNQNVIAGLGLGILLQPLPGFHMRVDYAVPLTQVENEGNNAQEEGFYFTVNYEI